MQNIESNFSWKGSKDVHPSVNMIKFALHENLRFILAIIYTFRVKQGFTKFVLSYLFYKTKIQSRPELYNLSSHLDKSIRLHG